MRTYLGALRPWISPLPPGVLLEVAPHDRGTCHQRFASPIQGWSLILVAPFVDHWVGGKWLLDYRLSPGATLALVVSCTVAIAVNMSQFACLGRFQAVTFQVGTLFILV